MGEPHGAGGGLCCFLWREGPLAKAASADLLAVTLGLVQRQQWKDLERGMINSGLHRCVLVFNICRRLLQMANLVCAH